MLLLRDRKSFARGVVVERVVWRLPAPSLERPHGFKYRLYCGQGGRCLVRYDNEAGKGDHKHLGAREVPYNFTTLDQLVDDFWADVADLRGDDDDCDD